MLEPIQEAHVRPACERVGELRLGACTALVQPLQDPPAAGARGPLELVDVRAQLLDQDVQVAHLGQFDVRPA